MTRTSQLQKFWMKQTDGDSGSEIGYDDSSGDEEEVESEYESDNSAFQADFGSDVCTDNNTDFDPYAHMDDNVLSSYDNNSDDDGPAAPPKPARNVGRGRGDDVLSSCGSNSDDDGPGAPPKHAYNVGRGRGVPQPGPAAPPLQPGPAAAPPPQPRGRACGCGHGQEQGRCPHSLSPPPRPLDCDPGELPDVPDFTGPPPRVVIDFGDDPGPIDFVERFLPIKFQRELKEQTNVYARQKRCGLNKKPEFQNYWSTDPFYKTPFAKKLMPRNRFLNILSMLHLADNTQRRGQLFAQMCRSAS